MFSFFGGKAKLAKSYPKPLHKRVIEPFAGSARYSLLHFDHEVILIEKDFKIYSIWDYLINHATPEMILSLPDVDGYKIKLETIEGFSQLADAERFLIGFCVNNGSAQPKNVSASTGNFNSWKRDKVRIARDLYKVKHWKIHHGDYRMSPVTSSTWFIDPPYSDKGKWYVENNIDYESLAQWCRLRTGQVIVCEAGSANWLPFVPLKEIAFTHYKTEEDKKKKTMELIWYRE